MTESIGSLLDIERGTNSALNHPIVSTTANDKNDIDKKASKQAEGLMRKF
jgi:hypothetical protein